MAPVELSSLIAVNSVENYTLKCKFLDSVYGRRSFSYAAPRLWNALPIFIRKLDSLDNFKAKLKYHLFNNSQEYMRSVNRYIYCGSGYYRHTSNIDTPQFWAF